MAGRGTGPDFVEALARGLDVLACFDDRHPRMSLTEIAEATGLARPTARRLLLTLAELGFVRLDEGRFTLTPQVLRLGLAYIGSLGLWGGGPAAPGGAGRADRGVVLDGPAGRLGHRVRGPGLGTQDHHAAGGDRHPVPGPADLPGQGAAGRAGPGCADRHAGRAQPVRPAPRPGAGPPGRRRRAAHGPGPRLGPGRRGAGPGHPLGGGAGPRRLR